MRSLIIPVFIGGSGCPSLEKCIFCDQSVTGGDVTGPDGTKKFIKTYITDICDSSSGKDRGGGEERRFEIAFYGGTFTALSAAERDAFFSAAVEALEESGESLSSSGLVFSGFRVSTRPDFIDRPVLDHLKKRGTKVVELGIESFDDGVLSFSRRGYTGAAAESAARLVKSFGFALSLHIMCGLPFQTRDLFFKDVDMTISVHPDFARIHPLCVVAGTRCEELYRQSREKYFFPDDELIVQTSYALAALELSAVKVIRVGVLENDKFRARVIAGPAYPNLREVAESRIHSVLFDVIRRIAPGIGAFQVETESEKAINFIKGYKRENIQKNKDIDLEFKNKMVYNNFQPSDHYINLSCIGHELFNAVFTREDILREYINSIKR